MTRAPNSPASLCPRRVGNIFCGGASCLRLETATHRQTDDGIFCPVAAPIGHVAIRRLNANQSLHILLIDLSAHLHEAGAHEGFCK